MSQTTQRSAAAERTVSDPLEEIAPIVDRAVEFAKRWEPPYRSHIFEIAIAQLVRGLQPLPSPLLTGVAGVGNQIAMPAVASIDVAVGTTGKVGRAIAVDPTVIERVIHSDADGKLTIVGRVEGKTRRELQIRYSLVYCFIKEIGMGQRDVDIEELRVLCIEQGCYDAPNFTANFRKATRDGLLLEVGGKVGRNRRFRASKRGLDEAAVILRQMAEG